MDAKKVNELLKQSEEKYASGDYKEAYRLVMRMSELGSYPLISHYMGGMLVDIGLHLRDKKIVRKAVEILEKDLKLLTKRTKIAPSVYYNLANGYSYLYDFKRIKDPSVGYLGPTELYKIREYLLKAIELKPKDKKFLSQIWTNLGNCFDYSGRVLDALECYEMALKYKPDHGMAMGNKGIALSYYAHVSGIHIETFLREAYTLIYDAIKLVVDPGIKNYFQNYFNSLKKYFADGEILETRISFPGCKAESTDKFEEFMTNFCLENKLYLNICNACQKCDEAIGDTVGIKNMIVSLKSSDGKIKHFYSLANYLNHIKQEIIHKKMMEMKNFALNAIYDIFQEFENGRYNKLRETRNALTHRFVNIRIIQENEDEENMSEDTLFEQTVELARIVRNVIIYLMNLVYLEEKAKEEKIGHKLPQIQSFEYPDDLKSYR